MSELVVLGIRTYTDKESGEQKAKFVRCGAAWKTRDGKGITIVLDAFPVSGKLVVKPDEPKQQQQQSGGRNDDDDIPF